MRSLITDVTAFHSKNKLPVGLKLADNNKHVDWVLALRAAALQHGAEALVKEATSDARVLRAHIMCEELAEAVRALLKGDEVELLDALVDLIYVAVGTAITYDLPLADAWIEIQRSNMTKERQDSGDDKRFRGKGPNFSPADLKTVLENHRSRLACKHPA
jgi:predicted HAD superfamily Cof-like phosphohydrolase